MPARDGTIGSFDRGQSSTISINTAAAGTASHAQARPAPRRGNALHHPRRKPGGGSTSSIRRATTSIAPSSCCSLPSFTSISRGGKLVLQHSSCLGDAPFHRPDRNAKHRRQSARTRSLRSTPSAADRAASSGRRRSACAAAGAAVVVRNASSCDGPVAGRWSTGSGGSSKSDACLGEASRETQRLMLFRRSMAFRHVIARSQVLNDESPRKVPSFRNAVMNASCATSSASVAEPTAARAARKTARRFLSTSSPNASRSPACARRTSRRSAGSAVSLALTRFIEVGAGTVVGKSRMARC